MPGRMTGMWTERPDEDVNSDYTSTQSCEKSKMKLPGTFGACSAFSFLTRSPCSVTRVYGQEAESAAAAGGAAAVVGGAMPGLYSTPVSFLN